MERLAALALLISLGPLLIAAAVILTARSRSSPLVAHRRVGRSGHPIWVFKLRTMWSGRPQHPSRLVERICTTDLPRPKIARDGRVRSRFAAFCRRYSIDELPQLWNVLRGDMALIGPRPLTGQEIETYYADYRDELLTKKPGLTGLWQVSGRSRLTYRQRRKLDLFLIRHWGIGLYIRVLREPDR